MNRQVKSLSESWPFVTPLIFKWYVGMSWEIVTF